VIETGACRVEHFPSAALMLEQVEAEPSQTQQGHATRE
jgi:hypothetical protein